MTRLTTCSQLCTIAPTLLLWLYNPQLLIHYQSSCRTSSPCQALRSLCKKGKLKEAMNVLNSIDQHHINADIYICLLQACISMKSFTDGRRVHHHILKTGFKPSAFLGGILVNMYLKCGSVVDARRVFDRMSGRNVFLWTIMIGGYAQHEQGELALELFWKMESEGVKPDKVTFLSILKACGSVTALEQGRQIHAHIMKIGYESDLFVGNALVDMYGKCGSIEDARQMFNKMINRDVISWTAMITCYSQHGYGEDAFEIFKEMEQEGVRPNKITFISVLKACISIVTLERGKQIHIRIIESGLESDVHVGNALIDMYAKNGSIGHACQVFDGMPMRDVISWTAMIACYVQHGHCKKALELFWKMEEDGVTPDEVTFVSILKACAGAEALEQGKEIHTQIMKSGLEMNVVVGSTLVDMYIKCGSLDEACKVFNKMPQRNAISWNAIIAGYALHGQNEKALEFFQEMQQEGMIPSNVTFMSLLKACGNISSLEQGKQIHAHITKSEFMADAFVWNSLIDMYIKCGNIKYASQVFGEMPQRDIVSWNTMIAGYTQHGHGREALKLFWKLIKEHVQPDEATFVSVLKACAGITALEHGRQIHEHVVRNGLESNVFVGSTLIDMYAKCGRLDYAHKVFNNMPERNVGSWNAIISAYAQHGHVKMVRQLAEDMQKEQIKLDHITFMSILSACGHAGLVDVGFWYFEAMSRDHGIAATDDHYACMVDLLGRAGYLEEARDFIKKIPSRPCATVWVSLLAACKMHGDMELARYAAQCITEVEPQNDVPLVLLSNMYAATGRWSDKATMRKTIEDRNIISPGCHSNTVNYVHECIVKDKFITDERGQC